MSRPKGSKNKPKNIIVNPSGKDDNVTIQKAYDSLPDNDDSGVADEVEMVEAIESEGIMINKNWKLTSDALNIILSKRSIVRKGKDAGTDKWLIKGYYGTIKGALESMVDKEIIGTGLKDLQTVDKKIDELKATIANLPIGRRNL